MHYWKSTLRFKFPNFKRQNLPNLPFLVGKWQLHLEQSFAEAEHRNYMLHALPFLWSVGKSRRDLQFPFWWNFHLIIVQLWISRREYPLDTRQSGQTRDGNVTKDVKPRALLSWVDQAKIDKRDVCETITPPSIKTQITFTKTEITAQQQIILCVLLMGGGRGSLPSELLIHQSQICNQKYLSLPARVFLKLWEKTSNHLLNHLIT